MKAGALAPAWLRRWRRQRAPGAAILYYHRVADLASDPQRLAVPPELFARQVRALHRHHALLSLPELVEALRRGHLPRTKPVVLTVDDGYADNLTHVPPILQAEAASATVFVTAGYVGGDREFWWDDVERVLLATARLPARIRVPLGDGEVTFDLDGATARQAAYVRLLDALRGMPGEARNAALDALCAGVGVGTAGRLTHRVLTPEGLRSLAATRGMTIGAHTLWHSSLAALPAEEAAREVVEGKRRLEALLGAPVEHFSYPFGQAGDYSATVQAVVQGAGFACACTTLHGILRSAHAELYALPRIAVQAVEPNALVQDLERRWGL